MIFGIKWTLACRLRCAKVRNRHGRSVAIGGRGGRGRVFLALRATGEKKVICRLLVDVDGNRVGIQERRRAGGRVDTLLDKSC